ncbi:MAG: NADH-quinone oxidoreductase subunit J [Deltaproteobacteria bacterium]|nr:MAG: NADH-quinone oxidoreductase subunit J [Deltaproteobacteria bacterium]
MQLAFFYFFSGLSILSALFVIFFRNTLSAAIALVVTLFGVACLFGLLEAHFLAAMQVLVYAGAVMVLFLFVIMLMNLGREELLKIKLAFLGIIGVITGVCLAILLVTRFMGLSAPLLSLDLGVEYGTVKSVGKLLFGEYLIPFELTSILLLVAIIGAITLARKPQS